MKKELSILDFMDDEDGNPPDLAALGVDDSGVPGALDLVDAFDPGMIQLKAHHRADQWHLSEQEFEAYWSRFSAFMFILATCTVTRDLSTFARVAQFDPHFILTNN